MINPTVLNNGPLGNNFGTTPTFNEGGSNNTDMTVAAVAIAIFAIIAIIVLAVRNALATPQPLSTPESTQPLGTPEGQEASQSPEVQEAPQSPKGGLSKEARLKDFTASLGQFDWGGFLQYNSSSLFIRIWMEDATLCIRPRGSGVGSLDKEEIRITLLEDGSIESMTRASGVALNDEERGVIHSILDEVM